MEISNGKFIHKWRPYGWKLKLCDRLGLQCWPVLDLPWLHTYYVRNVGGPEGGAERKGFISTIWLCGKPHDPMCPNDPCQLLSGVANLARFDQQTVGLQFSLDKCNTGSCWTSDAVMLKDTKRSVTVSIWVSRSAACWMRSFASVPSTRRKHWRAKQLHIKLK